MQIAWLHGQGGQEEAGVGPGCRGGGGQQHAAAGAAAAPTDSRYLAPDRPERPQGGPRGPRQPDQRVSPSRLRWLSWAGT